MFKRINNWHLSALIAIVSIFSIALIQQYTFAQVGWTNPNSLPGTTSDNNLVVNPVVDNLNLTDNGVKILGNNLAIDGSSATRAILLDQGRELCLDDVGGIPGSYECRSTWPTVAGGVVDSGGTENYIPIFEGLNGDGNRLLGDSVMRQNSDGLVDLGNNVNPGALHIYSFSRPTASNYLLKLTAASGTGNDDVMIINNYGTAQSLIVNDQNSESTPFVIGPSGKVGIGTADPNPTAASEGLLHIYAPVGQNAEIDIQSGGAGTNHWGIYQDKSLKGLKFWNTSVGNLITLGTDGDMKLGITAANPYPGLIWKYDDPTYQKSSAKIEPVIEPIAGSGTWARRGLGFFTNNSYDQTTDSIERMRITEKGDVGIGTSNPTETLEVIGTGKFTSLIVDDAVSANSIIASKGYITEISAESIVAESGLTLNTPSIIMESTSGDFCTLELISERVAPSASGGGHWDITCNAPEGVCGNSIVEPSYGEECDPVGSSRYSYDSAEASLYDCSSYSNFERARISCEASCQENSATCQCEFSCITTTYPKTRYNVIADCSASPTTICDGWEP